MNNLHMILYMLSWRKVEYTTGVCKRVLHERKTVFTILHKGISYPSISYHHSFGKEYTLPDFYLFNPFIYCYTQHLYNLYTL